MAANIQITTLTAAIKNVSVTGLVIYDLGEVPEQVDTRATAVLFPDTAGYVSDLSIENVTYGYNTAAKNARYRLNYVLAYKSITAGRRLNEYLNEMVQMAADICEALTTTDFSASGAMEFTVNCPYLGQMTDPAGNVYHGGRITIDVLELIQ